MNTQAIDLDRLLKLRLVIARLGEMDMFRWWNSAGQLGRVGSTALRRGLPRTHYFAQARSTFAIAAQRCTEVFDPPRCVTLWHFPEEIEEEFDIRWEQWIDNAPAWATFFERLEKLNDTATGAGAVLRQFELVSDLDEKRLAQLRPIAEGRAFKLPNTFSASDSDVTLLALGFARSEMGILAVPYADRGDD